MHDGIRLWLTISGAAAVAGAWAAWLPRNGWRFGIRGMLATMLAAAIGWWLLPGVPNVSAIPLSALATYMVRCMALPFVVAAAAVSFGLGAIPLPRHRDRTDRRRWHRPSSYSDLLPAWLLAVIAYVVLFKIAFYGGLAVHHLLTPSAGNFFAIASMLHLSVIAFAAVCMWNDWSQGRMRVPAHLLTCFHLTAVLLMQGLLLYVYSG